MVDSLTGSKAPQNVVLLVVQVRRDDHRDRLSDGLVLVYPNIRSAAAFHAEITPSRVLAMIASSEDSTIAAYRNRISSARVRSVAVA
jgi:hypothetical protein